MDFHTNVHIYTNSLHFTHQYAVTHPCVHFHVYASAHQGTITYSYTNTKGARPHRDRSGTTFTYAHTGEVITDQLWET